MTVIVKDDGVEKLWELGVRRVRTSIETDSRVEVFNTGENASLESDSTVIRLVLVLFPHFFSHASCESRLGSSGEESTIIFKLISTLECADFLGGITDTSL